MSQNLDADILLQRLLFIIQKGITPSITLFGSKYNTAILPDDIKSTIISDSILIWTDKLQQPHFFSILLICEQIYSLLMIYGFPSRSSIVIGQIAYHYDPAGILSRNILVGDAIIKAYEMDKSQHWSGIALHNDVIKYLESFRHDDNTTMLDFLRKFNFIVEYEIPKKEGPISKTYALNWVQDQFGVNESHIHRAFSSHGKKLNWDAKQKLDHTLSFYRKAGESTLFYSLRKIKQETPTASPSLASAEERRPEENLPGTT